MTIHLPEDLERFVQAEVARGHFASEDDAIAEAVRLLRRGLAPQLEGNGAGAAGMDVATAQKPIWEVIEDENRSLAPEVWEALPADLSAQHDHYIYGTPKRTDA
jgi:Arc/MetJ-type ribon-helix-helix transcriptional regulator